MRIKKPHPFVQYMLLLFLFPLVVVVQGFYRWLDFWDEVSA